MSNRICIQRCDFVDYPNRDVTYGFRAYDNYGQTYMNTCTIEQMILEPVHFLEWLAASVDDECLQEMIAFAKSAQSGMYVDDTWYAWEEISRFLEADSGETPGKSTHMTSTSREPRKS